MRRLLAGLVVALFAPLVFAGTAAAANNTFHFRFNGAFADAAWDTSTSTSDTFTEINPVQRRNGSQELFVFRTTDTFSNGSFTGQTDTFADVTSGFSFTIDKKAFSTASVSATGIPAQTCTYDADFFLIGCTDTTIDASASWTGQGPLTKTGEQNDHFHAPGFTANDHFSGTLRDATATGSFGGVTLASGDLQFAELGNVNSGSVAICTGGGC